MIDPISLGFGKCEFRHDYLNTQRKKWLQYCTTRVAWPMWCAPADAAPRTVSTSPELNPQHVTNLHSGSGDPCFCQHCTVGCLKHISGCVIIDMSVVY